MFNIRIKLIQYDKVLRAVPLVSCTSMQLFHSILACDSTLVVLVVTLYLLNPHSLTHLHLCLTHSIAAGVRSGVSG